MAKKSTIFFCQNCGYESAKWLGQCPACKEWNTLVEETVVTGKAGKSSKKAESLAARIHEAQPVKLSGIKTESEIRTATGFEELDRVLGGGIVAGSLVLVGGDPGIGKSTILLQVCKNLTEKGKKVLYISGEESLQQIKLRASRIGSFGEEMLLLCETSLETIQGVIERVQPEIVVIDSIQTMYQEHMVDTVLYFEGDRHAAYRILRGVKNRFGSTNEIGVFEMCQSGLKEVKNPSEYMLSGKPQGASGSIVSCSMEGTRPILVEVQALVCRSNLAMPRRTAAGTDYNRVGLLMAVIEKRIGMHLSTCDAYVNIAGGIRMNEPAIDLAIVLALISSYKDIAIDEKTLAFGEVGLSGEIRAVSMAQQRVAEAKKLGFETIILPSVSMPSIGKVEGIRLLPAANLREALKYL